MTTRTFAHISDLHLGRDAASERAAYALVHALLAADVDDVLLTGDVTHHGRASELATFRHAFAPIADRLLVVPGNHDRAGEDVAAQLMPGKRIQVARRPGMVAIRLDSTAPHNKSLLTAHGALSWRDITEIEAAVIEAPRESLVVLMLHHHLLPLPADHVGELLASWLGWPHAEALELGPDLLERLRGRCDLILHGHRHAPSERTFASSAGRPLRIVNAGCAPELGQVRLLTHGRGRLLTERWLDFTHFCREPKAVGGEVGAAPRPTSAAA